MMRLEKVDVLRIFFTKCCKIDLYTVHYKLFIIFITQIRIYNINLIKRLILPFTFDIQLCVKLLKCLIKVFNLISKLITCFKGDTLLIIVTKLYANLFLRNFMSSLKLNLTYDGSCDLLHHPL